MAHTANPAPLLSPGKPHPFGTRFILARFIFNALFKVPYSCAEVLAQSCHKEKLLTEVDGVPAAESPCGACGTAAAAGRAERLTGPPAPKNRLPAALGNRSSTRQRCRQRAGPNEPQLPFLLNIECVKIRGCALAGEVAYPLGTAATETREMLSELQKLLWGKHYQKNTQQISQGPRLGVLAVGVTRVSAPAGTPSPKDTPHPRQQRLHNSPLHSTTD